jgi:hypothetical protein
MKKEKETKRYAERKNDAADVNGERNRVRKRNHNDDGAWLPNLAIQQKQQRTVRWTEVKVLFVAVHHVSINSIRASTGIPPIYGAKDKRRKLIKSRVQPRK